MTRGLPVAFLTALQQSRKDRSQRPVRLFRIYYTSTLFKDVTNYHRAITFDGVTYAPRPIEAPSDVEIDSAGEEESFEVRLGDTDSFWKALSPDFAHRRVRMYRADLDHLSDPLRVLANTYVVDTWDWPSYEVVLNLASFRSLLQHRFASKITRAEFPGLPGGI